MGNSSQNPNQSSKKSFFRLYKVEEYMFCLEKSPLGLSSRQLRATIPLSGAVEHTITRFLIDREIIMLSSPAKGKKYLLTDSGKLLALFLHNMDLLLSIGENLRLSETDEKEFQSLEEEISLYIQKAHKYRELLALKSKTPH
ncbi:hypothetical protein NEF87_004908 [Candidatus Lokiarchaeum ossiferum]|uniref:ArnR1-like winged helix-turn-helix domain-containing protein n=1 Tax=Candidatus Lokiarchaeum ossiferum TaxID=2951803 RepID=A0ABY6HYL1_9ARCH|nr:hypothetical protein NEF87_004908 [Candidatus Lokiarchaeum sp. B-35]